MRQRSVGGGEEVEEEDEEKEDNEEEEGVGGRYEEVEAKFIVLANSLYGQMD